MSYERWGVGVVPLIMNFGFFKMTYTIAVNAAEQTDKACNPITQTTLWEHGVHKK
ncbi:MAG: hypothetical protein SVY10_19550 [Thermodesulfobacteriota bacterium]|nr:hypothetical protein [Thermodesulfobacteriota bacterium]